MAFAVVHGHRFGSALIAVAVFLAFYSVLRAQRAQAPVQALFYCGDLVGGTGAIHL